MRRSAPRKRGRPQATHRLPDGSEITGLSRQADGRWRISATGEVFFESDEYLAIARFEATVAKLKQRHTASLPLPPQPGPEAAFAAVEAAGATRFEMKFRIGSPVEYSVLVDGDAYWAAVRRHLLTDPKSVATKTGVEWVARGADLPRPMASPTLDELIATYAAKPGITGEEIQRCKKFWGEFSRIVGIKTIRELTHDQVATCESAVGDLGLSPKSVKHRYTRIRTVISYALKRGKGPADCRSALDVLAMLEAKDANPLDPRPISPCDFWAVYNAATRAEDFVFAAMMLFSLNAALYPSEVGSVRWDEIDLARGEYVSRRRKTGIVRVAVLWPETVSALRALPRDRDTVFNTSRQAYKRFSVHREWTTYRAAAEVQDGVTFAQIRDASFTQACRTSLDQARVLAGHKYGGATDAYVARNPRFVAKACTAIRAAYFPRRKMAECKGKSRRHTV
jgi:integrase